MPQALRPHTTDTTVVGSGLPASEARPDDHCQTGHLKSMA